MTGPIVFIAADPREFTPWIAKWTDVKRIASPAHWMQSGKWRDCEMIAIANGAGAERAYSAAMQVPKAAQFWNIGFAGAADPALRAGDILVATRVCANGDAFPCERPRADIDYRAGAVHSISSIAHTAREKSDHFRHGASVIEMEAAGIARAASELNAPFYCVRAVSDLAAEDFVNDFGAVLRPDGRFNVPRLLAGAFLRPYSRFGELIRLEKRTALAAKNLGEFLAHCEF